MKSLKKTAVIGGYILISLIFLHLSSMEALAAENSQDWRPTFDIVMRWVNFLILAFLLIKFSRLPIKQFLESKKEDIAREIETLEADKAEIVRQIDENRRKLENSKERLSQLKKTIVAQGEKNKLKIIADAERESKILLESAKQKIESRISDAREVLRNEMVDEAVDLAMKMLPESITDRDNQKFIDTYIQSAASS